MGLSKHEVDQLLHELDEKQGEYLKKNDPKGLANCYHPDAVLIHKGGQSWYGRIAIAEALTPICQNLKEFEGVQRIHTTSSQDGQLLHHISKFHIKGDPKDYHFEQIYKKEDDGEYLVIYDIFDFPI